MIVRKLTCAQHEEYGHDGWLPTWLERLGFDPVTGRAVSHDILEHMVDKIGGAEGEFMAFGALCWNRGDSGWFYEHSRYNPRISYQLSGDFHEILRLISHGEQSLKDPGRTYKLREDHDHWNVEFQEIVDVGFESAIQELDHNDDSQEELLPMSIVEAKRRIIGWMRKGFRKADEYYSSYHLNACNVSYIFDQITELVNMHSKPMEIGEVLTIKIDLWNKRVYGYKEYPYE